MGLILIVFYLLLLTETKYAKAQSITKGLNFSSDEPMLSTTTTSGNSPTYNRTNLTSNPHSDEQTTFTGYPHTDEQITLTNNPHTDKQTTLTSNLHTNEQTTITSYSQRAEEMTSSNPNVDEEAATLTSNRQTNVQTTLTTNSYTDVQKALASDLQTDVPTPLTSNPQSDEQTTSTTNPLTDVQKILDTDEQSTIIGNPNTDEQTMLTSNSRIDEPTTLTTNLHTNGQTALTSNLQTDEQTNGQTTLTTNPHDDVQTTVTINSHTDEQTIVTRNPHTDKQKTLRYNPFTDEQTTLTSNQHTDEQMTLTSNQHTDEQTTLTSNQHTDEQTTLMGISSTNEHITLKSSSHIDEDSTTADTPSTYKYTTLLGTLSTTAKASVPTTTRSATTTTTTAFTATLRLAPSTPPAIYTPKKENLTIGVKLDLVVEANYSSQLDNKTSKLYRSYENNFTKSTSVSETTQQWRPSEYRRSTFYLIYPKLCRKRRLRIAYNKTPGFKDVEVLGFRDGRLVVSLPGPSGIIVDHNIVLFGYADIQKSMKKLETEIIDHIDEVISENMGLKVNEDATKETVRKVVIQVNENVKSGNLCEFYILPCGFGYGCITQGKAIACQYYCATETKCGNYGQCYVDPTDASTKCRCIENDSYIYSGALCAYRTEKQKSDPKIYIAVSVGISGAVLFLLVVAMTAVICKRRRRRRRKKEQQREEMFDGMYLHPYGTDSEELQINRYGNKYRRNVEDQERQGNDYVRRTGRREEMYDEIPADMDESAQYHGSGYDGYIDLSRIEFPNTNDHYISPYYGRRQKEDGYSDIYSSTSGSQTDPRTYYNRSIDRIPHPTNTDPDYLRPQRSNLNTFKNTHESTANDEGGTIIYRGPQNGWR